MATKDYLTTPEAADALGVSRGRVIQFVRDGRLKAKRFGKIFLYPAAAIEKLRKIPRKPGPKKVRRTADTY